jgi:hypothetical protein
MADAKKDYEVAVENFEKADKEYKTLEERFSSGRIVEDLGIPVAAPRDDEARGIMEQAVEGFKGFWNRLKELMEERNVRVKNAQDALRQAVILAPTQWRGVDGKPTKVIAGAGFDASSVTYRSFDPQSLFLLLSKKEGGEELIKRLLSETRVTKDGKVVPIIEQTWEMDYPSVLSWLQRQGLSDVVNGAYDEKEGTPQVHGPKPVYFLGEEKKG